MQGFTPTYFSLLMDLLYILKYIFIYLTVYIHTSKYTHILVKHVVLIHDCVWF